MRKIVFITFLMVPLVGFGQENDLPEEGFFIFDKYEPLKNKPIKVWYHSPQNVHKDSPVLIVMHGNSRNAKGYRDALISSADTYGYILIVPEFSKTLFPKVRDYHHGGIFDAEKNLKPESEWTFSIVDPLLEEVIRLWDNNSSQYNLYGFSAGSQFVHRFMYMKPENKAKKIIAASAGTYTMPDSTIHYSYGIKDIPLKTQSLRDFYAKDFYVCVGTADTVLARSDLVKSRKANLQGRDRVERAHSFYELSQQKAETLKTEFSWKMIEVEGVGHSQAEMAKHVGRLFFKEK